MKNIPRSIFILAGLAVFAVFLAFHFFRKGDEVAVEIPEGASAHQITSKLKDSGVISSPTWFRILLKITAMDRKIKPGYYELRGNMAAEEVLWDLARTEESNPIRFTVPEGWRASQIASRLQSLGVVSEKAFLQAVEKEKLEGYLFPSTYFLEKKMSPGSIISMMTKEFDRQVRPLFEGNAPLNLSEREVLILASIVEREAVSSAERPLIAAVYLNRVKSGMNMEADPTVQYALGFWKKELSHADTRTESPYNTYLHSGLPPGPICSPGLESIRAVLNPAPIDALFFVSDKKGGHIFNTNYDEHKKSINRVKRLSRDRGIRR